MRWVSMIGWVQWHSTAKNDDDYLHGSTQTKMGSLIRFYSVLPLGKVDVPLVLPRRLQLLLVLKNGGVIV